MSLPIHLQNIKSSGVYRFVYDKSVISSQTAETLRLLVGYSDKGPFNTPVYITSRDEFIRTYGNISKRLEKKGIYFHRLALQALNAGPILCLNLKNFENQATNNIQVRNIQFIGEDVATLKPLADNATVPSANTKPITDVYDTNRFWALDPDVLTGLMGNDEYAMITATDSLDASCSVIIRRVQPAEYNLTIRQYYGSQEIPDYLKPLQNEKLCDFFADIYVFRGEFTTALCGEGGPLARYFDIDTTLKKPKLKTNYTDAFGEPDDVLVALANDPASEFIAGYRGTTIPNFKNGNGSYISLDLLFNTGYSDHKMLMKLDEYKLDRIGNESDAAYTARLKSVLMFYGNEEEEEEDPQIAENVLLAASNVADVVYPIYLPGYTYDNSHVDATVCLGVLTGAYGKGLQEALTNRVDVEYHYLVDTFDTLINGADKVPLAALAKKKDNCFAILNFPKIKDFINTNIMGTKKTLDFKDVIAQFTLPGEGDGASWCGYFTQVVLSDGSVKSTVPSAGLVSNLFMDKWSSRQPYYIVAGSQYGRLLDGTLVGPDYGFSKSDRDILEPFGINVIVYEPRRGTYINSEQTAKQIPVSGLSKIHIRELVIYLQDEIAELLETYRWELNTQVLRDKIKARADVILETVKNNGGVYDYLNVCDESNNTAETIDNELLVLDTHIEPARGAGKMVEQLFIYRTGEMRSTLLQG